MQTLGEEEPRARTPTLQLLSELLLDHENNALERVFRLLHILQPGRDFHMIFDGLRSGDAKLRAGSRELLEHLVPSELHDGIVSMADDAPDDERLDNASAFHDPPLRDELGRLRGSFDGASEEDRATLLPELHALYARALREMLTDPSGLLRSVASYHVAELGLGELRQDVESATRWGSDTLAEMTERALGLLVPEVSGAR